MRGILDIGDSGSGSRVTADATRAAKIRGVHLAIVVDNKDGDGNPGYRVKVKLPNLSASDSTCWARIAVPMAGAERGTYMLPQVDDQVLVVFEHGDMDRPIVIGSLWSSAQKPPEKNSSGKNDTKMIKSKAGHRIIFDDKAGSECVIIVDAKGQNKIVLDSANGVRIESAGDIELKAQTNVVIHAQDIGIGASAGVTMKGMQVNIHGTASVDVNASGSLSVAGGMVQINVGGGPATTVTGAGSGSIGGT